MVTEVCTQPDAATGIMQLAMFLLLTVVLVALYLMSVCNERLKAHIRACHGALGKRRGFVVDALAAREEAEIAKAFLTCSAVPAAVREWMRERGWT